MTREEQIYKIERAFSVLMLMVISIGIPEWHKHLVQMHDEMCRDIIKRKNP